MDNEAVLLPEGIKDGELQLRRWTTDDLFEFDQAIATSAEHLRPWMPWIAFEPQTLEQRLQLINSWELEWAEGGNVHMGIFVNEDVVGGIGLSRRDEQVLEVGYWLHPDAVGQGFATRAAQLITSLAFTVSDTKKVKIRHDKANHRSGAIPARLGFELVHEAAESLGVPAESGTVCVWLMDRDHWEKTNRRMIP